MKTICLLSDEHFNWVEITWKKQNLAAMSRVTFITF